MILIKMRNKIYFITFGNEKFYNSLNRIYNEALSFNIFDDIILNTNIDLKNNSEFWNPHSDFIEKNNKVYIIDFGDAVYTKNNIEMNWFLSYFLGGHNGWNPDFK